MATGALGSVSNRLRHENGDTHVVVCDDVFSDAGSTPAASTTLKRKWLNRTARKPLIQMGLCFVARIETFAGCGHLSRRLQYASKISRFRDDPFPRFPKIVSISRQRIRSTSSVPAASKASSRNEAGILDADVAEGPIPAAQHWKVTIFGFWSGPRLSSLAESRSPSDARASRPH